MYVCVGAELSEVTTVLAVPSPQEISQLLGFPYVATGVFNIVNVTGLPMPAAKGLALNAGVFTYVLFLTFSIASFKSSIASVTLVVESHVLTVPGVKLPGLGSAAIVGNPNGIAFPTTAPPPVAESIVPVIVMLPVTAISPFAVKFPNLTLPYSLNATTLSVAVTFDANANSALLLSHPINASTVFPEPEAPM